MRILYFTKYDYNGASSRLRFLQYIERLENDGHSVYVQPFFCADYLNALYSGKSIGYKYFFYRYWLRLKCVFTCKKYDLVMVEKEVFPYLPSIFERLFIFNATRYTVDFDDAVFLNYKNNFLLKRKYRHLLKHAHCVFVGNRFLNDFALQQGASNVVYLPTVVDTTKYRNGRTHVKSDQFNIGWIGSPSTTKYLEVLREPLAQLAKKHDFIFTTVGASSFHDERFETKQLMWTESNEVDLINTMDVGVMPLYDTNWERGKCGYKLIQYMACGLPVIASPVGINKEIVTADVGYLCETGEDWLSSLEELSENQYLRESLGERSIERVHRCFSLNFAYEIVRKNIA